MTATEFEAITGMTFPLSLNDLPAALGKLTGAGYTARVADNGPGNLVLEITEAKESVCDESNTDR